MLIGYARVSTQEQSLDVQTDALSKAGCEKIFTDIASGAADARPGLGQVLEFARAGDTLVIWKPDRLGRSLRHLIELVNTLQTQRIELKSLQEAIDTGTSAGKLFFHIFGAIAEFERDLIRERTQAGLAASRARGRKGGRPMRMTESEIRMARKMLEDPMVTATEVAKQFRVSRSTLYRHLSKG